MVLHDLGLVSGWNLNVAVLDWRICGTSLVLIASVPEIWPRFQSSNAFVTHSRAYIIQTGVLVRREYCTYLRPLRLTRLSDVPSRSSLRSASSNHLLIRRLVAVTLTLIARAFPVVRPALRNSLPADITSFDSHQVLRRRLQTYLFYHSNPDAVQ